MAENFMDAGKEFARMIQDFKLSKIGPSPSSDSGGFFTNSNLGISDKGPHPLNTIVTLKPTSNVNKAQSQRKLTADQYVTGKNGQIIELSEDH